VNWRGEFTTFTNKRVAPWVGQAAASFSPTDILSANCILSEPVRAGRAQTAPKVCFWRKTAAVNGTRNPAPPFRAPLEPYLFFLN